MNNMKKTTFLKIKNESKTNFQEIPRPIPRVTHMFSDPRKKMKGVPGPENNKMNWDPPSPEKAQRRKIPGVGWGAPLPIFHP